MIPQRHISLIANGIATATGRRIPEAVIERDYVLAWFLTCLGNHALRDFLVFKGGTALRRCWIADYRFSEDMDFTVTQPIEPPSILAAFADICQTVESASGVRLQFDREAPRQGRNSFTFYLRYQGPLPAQNDVKVDVTLKEKICFPLVDRPILRQYDRFDDLPEGPTVKSYSLEEIVVEKIAAVSDRARNEPRDLYDLWYLLDHHNFWLPGMIPELELKLAFRGRSTTDVWQGVALKEDRLRRLWEPRLSRQLSELPSFERAFREVSRQLREAKLNHRRSD